MPHECAVLGKERIEQPMRERTPPNGSTFRCRSSKASRTKKTLRGTKQPLPCKFVQMSSGRMPALLVYLANPLFPALTCNSPTGSSPDNPAANCYRPNVASNQNHTGGKVEKRTTQSLLLLSCHLTKFPSSPCSFWFDGWTELAFLNHVWLKR